MEVKRRTAKTLVNRLSSDSEPTRSAAIAELRLLSKWDSSNRRTIAEAGTIPRLIPLLFSNNPTSKDIASNSTEPPSINPTKQQLADQENAITCLLNLSILPENRSEIISARGFPSALLHILRWGRSAPAIQNAAATVYSLLVDESLRPILGGWTDTVSALIDILRRHTEDDPRTTKDSLKALFAIALYPLNRPRMVEMGAVPALLSILIAGGSTGVVEDASAVAAQVSGCEEAAEAFKKANGLRVLVDLMEGALSPRTRENAAAALLSLARSGGDRVARQIKELETTQAAIGKLMKSDSQKARSKAEALQSILDMQHETLTKDSWVKPVSEVDEEDDQFV